MRVPSYRPPPVVPLMSFLFASPNAVGWFRPQAPVVIVHWIACICGAGMLLDSKCDGWERRRCFTGAHGYEARSRPFRAPSPTAEPWMTTGYSAIEGALVIRLIEMIAATTFIVEHLLKCMTKAARDSSSSGLIGCWFHDATACRILPRSVHYMNPSLSAVERHWRP